MVFPRYMPAKDAFLLNFPREVLEDVFRAIVATYPATLSVMQEQFPEDEGIDLRPHYQRALVDRDLRAVAEKHKVRGITYASKLNANGGARHLEVYSRTSTMTAHYVPWKSGTVRPAVHRIKLCDPAQGNLFEAAAVSVETKLYAHLLHGCSGLKAWQRVKRAAPDFAYIRFPSPDMSTYSDSLIDLILEFPDVLGAHGIKQSTPVNEVPDLALPVLPGKPAVGTDG